MQPRVRLAGRLQTPGEGEKEVRETLPRDREGRHKPDTAVTTLLTALSLSSPGWATQVTSHAP